MDKHRSGGALGNCRERWAIRREIALAAQVVETDCGFPRSGPERKDKKSAERRASDAVVDIGEVTKLQTSRTPSLVFPKGPGRSPAEEMIVRVRMRMRGVCVRQSQHARVRTPYTVVHAVITLP